MTHAVIFIFCDRLKKNNFKRAHKLSTCNMQVRIWHTDLFGILYNKKYNENIIYESKERVNTA